MAKTKAMIVTVCLELNHHLPCITLSAVASGEEMTYICTVIKSTHPEWDNGAA